MKVTVIYQRYFQEASLTLDSIEAAIDFIDSEQHYAYAAVLEDGRRIEVDPDPLFGGGPTYLRKRLADL